MQAQARIEAMEEERKALESSGGLVKLVKSMDPDVHEGAVVALLEQLAGRHHIMERIAKELFSQYLDPESAMALAVGVRTCDAKLLRGTLRRLRSRLFGMMWYRDCETTCKSPGKICWPLRLA